MRIDDMDRHKQLVEWNSTAVEFPGDCFVADLITAQALERPDATALECNGMKLSYGELEVRSNQLARYLRSRYSICTDSVVGLLVERSFEMIVGLVGILKAGAAYLPLDPAYPPERLAYMLANASAHVVLTHGATRDTLPIGSIPCLRLDASWHEIEREPRCPPDPKLSADNLAYIIYTSGSTGNPKGVLIPHRALSNHMLWMRNAFPLSHDDVLLQKTPLSFDASVWEVFAPLLSGARLVLAKPNGHKDPTYLCEVIRGSGVTILQLVPSMLRLFLKEPSVERCCSLRHVFSGGEALTADLAESLFARLPAQLHNLYGPTETCIQAVVYSCSRGERYSVAVPIGRPISNTQVYVLDEHLQLVPIGAEGELYIGGAGLARGYCGSAAVNQERFINNPFGTPGTRLYRTGDTVRYRPDGNLEFVGRVDGQAKLRGFRIELGEIEEVLSRHSSVREAAAAVVDDLTGNKVLIAHVVTAGGSDEQFGALRNHLAGFLPEFMIPSQFVRLAELPRLPSGKIDRNALATTCEPVRGSGDRESFSGVESTMADIWERVLNVRSIGRHDDFFYLGGSSIQLLYVFLEANEYFGTSVSVDEVKHGATLAQMAALFEDERANRGAAVG